MEEVAKGAEMVKQVAGEALADFLEERLRIFTDSHAYWNDFINDINYPCPVRVQNSHFRRSEHRKIVKGTRNP